MMIFIEEKFSSKVVLKKDLYPKNLSYMKK